MGPGYQNLECLGKLNGNIVMCLIGRAPVRRGYEGSIVEKSDKDAFFTRPQSDRARDFLQKILV